MFGSKLQTEEAIDKRVPMKMHVVIYAKKEIRKTILWAQTCIGHENSMKFNICNSPCSVEDSSSNRVLDNSVFYNRGHGRQVYKFSESNKAILKE